MRAAHAGAVATDHAGLQDWALISLLHALKSEHRIVEPKGHGLTRNELQTRAEKISPGGWVSEAVCEAIEAVMDAVIFGGRRMPS